MSIKIGNLDINSFKVGNSDCKIYLGDVLLYPESQPTHDYSQDYLTFEALEDGTFRFTNPINYSIDNGTNWTELAANTPSPTITSGNKIMWKASLAPSNNGIGRFSSTGQFDVEGNAMSLLFGDDFEGQTDLTGKDNAFNNLFSGCTGMTSAENLSLPATTLAERCYNSMFYNCTSLQTAHALPATTLAEKCYYNMFYNCTRLTTAPALSATTLAEKCYQFMFKGCTSLTTAPQLPATTLANYCYSDMFNGCTSLQTAPALPATTLAERCYNNMFKGCTSLTTAPELPATTLASSCYNSMFSNCTNLTIAPELPATTLAEKCYQNMFYNCSRLYSIICLATDISASNCTNNWLFNVSLFGTFYKNASMTSWTTGTSGIPEGWTIESQPTHDYSQDYLTFVANTDGTFKFSGNSVSYSVDNGSTWTELARNTNSPTVTAGNKIMWKAELTPVSSYPSYGIGTFSSTGNFNVEGNPMSLLYGDNFIGQTDLTGKKYAFYGLFDNCSKLISAENLSLPATTLAHGCYNYMFQGCTSLTTAPELPATTLANYCYSNMFNGCTSLTTAPALPAITLVYGCYVRMFNSCTSLTTAPELPSTTLANNCYFGMFSNCTNLTIAPELPATTLAERCYSNMFNGCKSLNTITCLATDISADSCTFAWVEGVASSGTFTKAASMSSWTTGASGIPNGWTVQDIS